MFDENAIKKKGSRSSKSPINHEGFTFKLKYEGRTSSLYWYNLIRGNNSQRRRHSFADCCIF